MRDEQVGQAELRAQALEQVEHLRLDQHVERRDRLVADDQRRVEGTARGRWRRAAPGRPESWRGLALAVDVGIEPDAVEHLAGRAAGAARGCRRRRRPAAPRRCCDDPPLRVEGAERVLEDHLHATGAPRAAGLPLRPTRSVPWKTTEPDFGRGACSSERASVDFPSRSRRRCRGSRRRARRRRRPETACTTPPLSRRGRAPRTPARCLRACEQHPVAVGAHAALLRCRRGTSTPSCGRARPPPAAAPLAAALARVRDSAGGTGSRAGSAARSGGRPGTTGSSECGGALDPRDRLEQRLRVGHPHVREELARGRAARPRARRTSRPPRRRSWRPGPGRG